MQSREQVLAVTRSMPSDFPNRREFIGPKTNFLTLSHSEIFSIIYRNFSLKAVFQHIERSFAAPPDFNKHITYYIMKSYQVLFWKKEDFRQRKMPPDDRTGAAIIPEQHGCRRKTCRYLQYCQQDGVLSAADHRNNISADRFLPDAESSVTGKSRRRAKKRGLLQNDVTPKIWTG